jgi:hypothetical protein
VRTVQLPLDHNLLAEILDKARTKSAPANYARNRV